MTRTQADADTLYRRLEDGYAKIEAAQQAGRDTAFLDEFWLSLLREYEAVVSELQKAHDDEQQRAEQKGMFS